MSLVTPRIGYKSVPWLFGKEIEIPDEWEVKKFKDIAKIRRGASPRPIEDSKYFGKGRGWIRISDVSKSKKYLEQTTDFLSDLGESKSVAVNNGDVILSIAASVGKPIIIKMKACIHDGFITFTNMSNTMNNEFLYYFLLKTKSTFTNIGQHGTQSNINSEIVSKTNFLKPPLLEQQKIANILSNVDNLIESTVQVIVHSKKVKTGLMQKLLTQGIDHVKFKKVPWLFGKEIEIPEEWEVKKIKDVTKISVGLVINPSTYFDKNGTIPMITGKNVTEKGIILDDVDFISEKSNELLETTRIWDGDLVTMRVGYPGRTCLVKNEHDGINCASVIITRKNKTYLSQFLQYLTNSKLITQQITKYTAGGAQQVVNINSWKEFLITYPSLLEQQKIASILSNIDVKITSQEQYKEKLLLLKKSLMQKLLTGEVRV